MKPLVIGGTGFIGYNIVQALQAKGHHVRCTRRESSNTLFLRKLKPELVVADIEDTDSLRRAMRGCDVVFMAAGHYPRYSVGLRKQVAYAVSTIRNVLQAARETGINRFVFTSSVTTLRYAGGHRPVSEADGIAEPPGRSVYFAVKYAMEKEVEKELDRGMGGVILNVAGCLGPGDVKMGTGFFVVEMANRTLERYIDGPINFVDSGDVAGAHVAAALHESPARRYIVGNHNTTVTGLLTMISERYGVPMPLRKIPLRLGYRIGQVKEYAGYIKKQRVGIPLEFIDMLRFGQHYDCAKAREELCSISTPFEDTLDTSYDWFKKYKYIR
jgi:dihydroflavonol-4-reductase